MPQIDNSDAFISTRPTQHLRPPFAGDKQMSKGFRARQGFGDAMAGLPWFSADRSYQAGYARGLEERKSR